MKLYKFIKLKFLVSGLISLTSISCFWDSNERIGDLTFEEASEIAINELISTDSSVVIYGYQETISNKVYSNFEDSISIEEDSYLFIQISGYPIASPLIEFGYFCLINKSTHEIKKLWNVWINEEISTFELIYPKIIGPISKEIATAEVLKLLLPNFNKSLITMYPELIEDGKITFTDTSDHLIIVDSENWLFILDNSYIIMDYRRNNYILLMNNKYGYITQFRRNSLPSNLETSLDTVYNEWNRASRDFPNLNFSSNSEQRGCGYDYIYSENEDENAIIFTEIDTTKLIFTNDSLEFEIGDSLAGFDLVLLDYYFLPPNYRSFLGYFCDDIGLIVPTPINYWYPVNGQVLIIRERNNDNYWYDYYLTIELSNIEFESDSYQGTITLPYHKINKIMMGWMPG